MNCKPGDMAIYIGEHLQDHGKIVRVVSWDGFVKEPGWFVDPPMESHPNSGCLAYSVLDRALRPIRPDETPEESLEAMRLLTQIPKEEKV